MSLTDLAEERRRAREELVNANYGQPNDECDVVMKGGITSGVIYPLAVCGLAKRYRFRNVGGASAGAIAAAAAAAAETGRARGGFRVLAGLPDALGDTLSTLFQGSKKTDPLLRVLKRGVAQKSWPRKVIPLIATAVAARLMWVIGGAAVFGGAGWGIWAIAGGRAGSIRTTMIVIGAVVGGLLGAIAGLVWTLLHHVPRNHFGICSGLSSSGEPAVTDWLSKKLDEIAGLGPDEGPLTFGHLWGEEAVKKYRGGTEKSNRGTKVLAEALALADVDLQMMTTNLTFRLPQRIPFTREYLFCPIEMERVLPADVCQHMIETSEVWKDGNSKDETFPCPDHPEVDIRCLPAAPDIPVVLAARLSLSFPVLISAVPLFAVDRSRKLIEDWKPVRCWFSDGGISSNFPIHFFDALLPTRPTFGIDLDQYHPDYPDDEVFYPGTGRVLQPQARTMGSLVGFLQAILDTMQNWSDRAQSSLAGYRERVVHVHYGKGEGGMNLAMPPEVIEALANRGVEAAKELESFDNDQHRWTRFRISMAELEQAFRPMRDGYGDPHPAGSGYRALIEAYGGSAEHYNLEGAALLAARERTAALMELIDVWSQGGKRFVHGAPSPDPDLRITHHF